MHYCAYHKQEHEESAFKVKANGKLDSWCHEGRKEYGRAYSRRAYAPRKAEVAQARLIKPTVRRCIDCGYERPIEDFPDRRDRPGRKHSRCHEHHRRITQSRNQAYTLENRDELLAYRKRYQASHPGYNRESTRRRRGQMAKVRHEPYKDDDVYERDRWICQLCHEPIDPALVYPHPDSGVIDHIHPISKYGPDTLNNVQQAHGRCNNAKHNAHLSPFADWEVRSIDRALARRIAKERHYLHRCPNTSFAFGLFAPGKDEPSGIVTFGSPSSWRINKSICPDNPHRVIELNRLWIDDSAPYGAASWFISRALKQLPPLIVVSYADTGVANPHTGTSHNGTVYRALSFNYAGRTRPRTEWRMPGKARNVGKIPGAVRSPVTAKERYWTVTGTPSQRRALRALSRW